MWALKTIGYTGLYFALCILSLFNPIFGVVNYMLVYQIDPNGTWWGQPLQAMGLRLSFTAALFTILGLILSGRKVPKIRPLIDSWECGVVALVLIAFFSILIGVEYGRETAIAMDKFWKMMLFVLILGRLATTRQNLRIVLWTIVIGTLYLGREAYIAHPDSFARGRLNAIGGADFRYSSGISAHLSAMLPLVGALFLTSKHWYSKGLTLLTGALALNAIIMCRTRSAVVGLAVGGVVALLFTPRGRRIAIYLTLLLCVPFALRLADSGFWERTMTMFDPDITTKDVGVVDRLGVWSASLKMIQANPLGIGIGNFLGTIDDYYIQQRASHNTLVNCVAELGIQGGCVFLFLIVGCFRKLRRVNRLADLSANPLESRCLAYGCLIAIVTYLVTGSFTERFYAESFWWIMTLPLCLERVVVREVAELATAPRLELEGDRMGSASAHVDFGLPCLQP